MGKLINDGDLQSIRLVVKYECAEARCRSVMIEIGGVKTRKRSTVACKSDVYLWLRSVLVQEVTIKIRMGDIVVMMSTWVNVD